MGVYPGVVRGVHKCGHEPTVPGGHSVCEPMLFGELHCTPCHTKRVDYYFICGLLRYVGRNCLPSSRCLLYTISTITVVVLLQMAPILGRLLTAARTLVGAIVEQLLNTTPT